MTTPRVWLVTGASSGFGKSVAEFALAKGDIVVAALRKPEMLQDLWATYSKDRLLVLKVDVTNQADIDHAFAQTKEVFGRLDVVFNNAGTGIVGEAEMTPLDTARSMFDVNFWGAVYVSRAAIKFFREVNEPGRGGVLLQNSSMFAIIGTPGAAFYGASKQGEIIQSRTSSVTNMKDHLAFDGFSEALAMEILPQWNIKICIIQAGLFATNLLAHAVVLPENTVYSDKTSALAATRSMATTSGSFSPGDPAKFTKAIYSLVEGGNIPLHLPIGHDALEAVQRKVELLGKVISEATPWSADLSGDDVNLV